MNPFLPINIYIPDGEPHVFDDRLYIFGSHDKERGESFCELGYEFYSAPLNDLTKWTSKGINYDIKQDPLYKEGYDRLYAPDVVKGNDGRYYLYYSPSGGNHFTGPLHVAVCDTPDGRYEYYGEIKYPDGRCFDKKITFDPGVINDDGVIRMYYGWSLNLPKEHMSALASKEGFNYVMKMVFNKSDEQLANEDDDIMNAYEVRLADDMLTVIEGPKKIIPGLLGSSEGSFKNHGFFEASSIRKINNKYYFIYSSLQEHELCYAISDKPDEGFEFKGTIISNGDIGLNNRKKEDRLNITGNNHGSIVNVNDKYYIAYHRHTGKNAFSRQAMMEEISFNEDGSINQVEMTSIGNQGKPLNPNGEYSSFYACNVTNNKMPHIGIEKIVDVFPHFTSYNDERYISEITDGSLIAYKYFDFNGIYKIILTIKGQGEGEILLEANNEIVGKIKVNSSDKWQDVSAICKIKGIKDLTIKYFGSKTIDLLKIRFEGE